MKLPFLALSVALLFTAGEGLSCNYCQPGPAGEPCEVTKTECEDNEKYCGFATYRNSISLQECMTGSRCSWFQRNPDFDTDCCTTDFCNTLPNHRST